MHYNWIVEDKIFFNLIYSTRLYLNKQGRFDCVQHDILILKLDTLNLDQNVVDWLKDYLRDCKQQVLANNHISTSLDVKQGVPQGSIIGPMMYIIYANDISRIIKYM